MTQGSLFDRDLERVSSRIANAVVAFCSHHPRFHMDDLRRYIVREVGTVAPGSPDRILRDLRARGVLRYRVVSRHQSLYEMESA